MNRDSIMNQQVEAFVISGLSLAIIASLALAIALFINLLRKKRMGTVTINGVTYTGNNICIRGNHVTIDGVTQTDKLSGVVEVRVIEGTINKLESDASISCGDVAGSVSAGGSVQCDAVGGNVSAGGSVQCDDIGGNCVAGGSIRRS